MKHNEMKDNNERLLKIDGYDIPENVYLEGGIDNNVVNQIIYNAINNYDEEAVTDCVYLVELVLLNPELREQTLCIAKACYDIREQIIKSKKV